MTVTVYTKEDCQPCKATLRLLKELRIDYEEKSTADPKALAEAKALGYLGAPVVVVDGSRSGSEPHWYGFRPDLIREMATESVG